MLVETVEGTHLPDDTEHQFAGAACLRVRDGEHSSDIGIQMMVDKNTFGSCGCQCMLHLIDTTGRVVVQTKDEVGNLQQQVAFLMVLVVAHDLLSIGQPQ